VIRVVIAEDQKMVLGALSALLEMEGDIQVVGRAPDGAVALELVKAEKPDVLISDAILRLAEEGRSNKDIADVLDLSPGTVRNYLSEAAQKLGAANRVEAGRIARSNGWL